MCETVDIYVVATVDQGGKVVNAFKKMKVLVLLCSGHQLNSVIYWALCLGGSYHADGRSTCKKCASREMTTFLAAMVGDFSHSAVNNDAFKAVQADVEKFRVSFEPIRRNDTRYS